jgi:16S rRNA (guanine527-N7)-methyltransferase
MKDAIIKLYEQHAVEFEQYRKELLSWNEKFNLTAITDPEEIRVKHFLDSLSVLEALPEDFGKTGNAPKVIDFGTGAGFPGLPLKIVCPEIKLTLLEATRKKTEFLTHIVEALNLKDVEVIWGRSEEYSKKAAFHMKYDLVLARAVAKLPALIESGFRFMKYKGLFVAQKGENISEELKESQNILKKVHAKIEIVDSTVILPNVRKLVIIKNI